MIVTVIGVAPVAIIFAVRLVVLVGIAHEILQGEAVMDSDEIDARPRPPTAISENIRGTRDPRGEIGDETPVASPEAPHSVAILSVPFGPAGREVAELITVG